jgi:hypothetical protein
MKRMFLCLGLLAIICITAQSAYAGGFGVYGTGGVAFMNWQNGSSSNNSTDYFYGGGIVIDSTVSKNQVFGYRFTAGYEQYIVTFPDLNANSDPVHRVSMSHTFGFGMFRSESVRLWMGPRIGMHYLFKHESGYNIDAVGADALLGLGLNINAGDTFTFFFDLGFGYMGIYNIKTSEIGHSFGIDGKLGFMFRINDTYAKM